MESRHCGQDKGIFFCPVHNASTPCSFQAFGIRCIKTWDLIVDLMKGNKYAEADEYVEAVKCVETVKWEEHGGPHAILSRTLNITILSVNFKFSIFHFQSLFYN